MGRQQALGKEGEAMACRYLQEQGYTILHTNYRFEHKEIDVIALRDDVLVFAEIKARSHFAFGYPEEAVGPRKQQLLKEAAAYYCSLYPQYEKIRFDVLSLLVQQGVLRELLHFEDAFY